MFQRPNDSGKSPTQPASAIRGCVFMSRFAYSGVPVVITDAMVNWTAPDVFSLDFFRSIYLGRSHGDDDDCQFFPYTSGFHSLGDALAMSDLEAESRPWYIGWSNCDPRVAAELRRHYQRPYFLPALSEGSRLDWIFMGRPGHGAKMHIDHVGNPSWQAQVRGSKRWRLEPPGECFMECVPLEVGLYPGDVIVVDTNLWFHETLILGGDLSITIGSEFD
ncbi:hypothetical protein LAZ67_10000383 [Cordylochernes scorpioides]|uniref:Cupin-like domain-containing protein n=1 Tax=Cordylochernes scorpioides TaxID=51811 RepID=A0ABY6KYS9_9ARAC|nr:hypothetical protein LAZ67_10000383 [Cordylochernes scorpioides]